MLQLIQSNEQAFLDFINTDDDDTTAEGEAPQQQQPQSVFIRLTEEEKTAIERLKALGFPEELVIQVSYSPLKKLRWGC